VPDAFTDCGGQCQSIEYVKKRKTLVVSGPGGLSSFLVNKDGSLTSVAGSPFGAAGPFAGVGAVTIGPRAFVYSPEFDTGDVHGFEVGADGVLAALPSSPFEGNLHAPGGVVARKRFLFVADQFNDPEPGDPVPNALAVFTIGADGTPTAAPGTPLAIPDATFVYNIGADAAGKTVYLAADAGDPPPPPVSIHAFAIDKQTGAPTELAQSPFPTALTQAFSVGAIVGTGIVVAGGFEGGNDDLAVFKTGKGGVLTPLGTASDSLTLLRTMTFGGRFVYAASADFVQVIAVRKRDGAIALAPEVAIGAGDTNPIGIVVLNR
jgi:hypothetical protein